jgi:hypothetical protein
MGSKMMASQTSFYYIHWADKPGLAVAQGKIDREVEKRLVAGGSIRQWDTPSLQLDRGIVVDYLANTPAFRLCSERLREVIENNRGDHDILEWLPVGVADGVGAELPYWVLHFPEVPDVIHKTRSVFSSSVLVKACIDTSLATGHRVFTLSRYGVYLVVTYQVKTAITQARCTGIEFSRMPSE